MDGTRSRTNDRRLTLSRHRRLLLPAVASIMVLAFALLPEGRLGCTDPIEREASPDGAWELTLCRRPMWFAMPGSSGDAPGWIVLRDAQGGIGGVVDLSMVQNYRAASGTNTVWEPGRAEVPLVAEFKLTAASGPFPRWINGQIWRWRALLGLVPTDDMFH